MNNKLIFRILGALASALIIVSVFVPYLSVNGNGMNLWDSYQIVNSLYLPIMIIVFGGIGVIFFSLNIKTEFAYMSAGAMLFFLVMQTIVYMDTFNSLNLGYYFQAIGTVVTGAMAFLCNLRPKTIQQPMKPVENNTESSMLDQIDKLYNDHQVQEQPQEIQPISIEPIQSVQIEPQIQTEINNVEPIQPVNPVLQDFFQQPVQPIETVQSVEPIQPEINNVEPMQPVNPVLQQFTNPTASTQNNNVQNMNNNGVDIFGQPINK